MNELVDTPPKRTRMTINWQVYDVGTCAGMSELTPRTLRHTLLQFLADKSRDIDDVMRFRGRFLKLAVGCVRTTDCERDRPILEGGVATEDKMADRPYSRALAFEGHRGVGQAGPHHTVMACRCRMTYRTALFLEFIYLG